MAEITLHVTTHAETDGSFWSEVSEFPGCFSSGFSLAEARDAAIDAIQLCLPDGITLGEASWSASASPDGRTLSQLLVA